MERCLLLARNGHADCIARCPLSGAKRKTFAPLSFSGFEPGCVKTPTLNLRVEFPSRFHRCGKPIALATSVRRRQLRKQFCASLAQASFHTAWSQTGQL